MIPTLNYVVLINALHALKEGNVRHCEALGFTFDEMTTLNKLSLDELFILSQSAAQLVTISVRHEVLRYLIAQARRDVRHQRLVNQAIRLGGSIALLSQYFGLTSNETCLRRRLLGVSVPYGRTPEPDEETDSAIWKQWLQCRVDNLESSDALAAMMLVTERLLPDAKGLSLTTVWKRIALCEKEAADRRASHAG